MGVFFIVVGLGVITATFVFDPPWVVTLLFGERVYLSNLLLVLAGSSMIVGHVWLVFHTAFGRVAPGFIRLSFSVICGAGFAAVLGDLFFGDVVMVATIATVVLVGTAVGALGLRVGEPFSGEGRRATPTIANGRYARRTNFDDDDMDTRAEHNNASARGSGLPTGLAASGASIFVLSHSGADDSVGEHHTGLLVNVDGTPMIEASVVDMNGNSFGVTSDYDSSSPWDSGSFFDDSSSFISDSSSIDRSGFD